MVSWQMLVDGNGIVVTFDEEDVAAWQEFETKSYGVAALRDLPLQLEMGGATPSSGFDPMETKKRRHLSLPEAYYAAAIDNILLVNEPLQKLWERLKSSSATFTRNFITYQHFRRLGWTPRSGLNYGAHYVLYRGSAANFHSEYVVYVQDDDKASSWNCIQSLTRIAADVKKTVLMCAVKEINYESNDTTMRSTEDCIMSDANLTFGIYNFYGIQYTLEAIAIRFWDASIANNLQSFVFQPQPVLPKNKKLATKKKRVKRPRRQLESEVSTGSSYPSITPAQLFPKQDPQLIPKQGQNSGKNS